MVAELRQLDPKPAQSFGAELDRLWERVAPELPFAMRRDASRQ